MFTFANEEFATHANVCERVGRRHGGILSKKGEVRGQDLNLILAMLCHHPKFITKRGCGIASIHVRDNLNYIGTGLYIHRTDGTWVDFSYFECF